MKHNGYLTFQYVIDYWGAHSDTKYFYGMLGAIVSFNVVHVDSVVIIVSLKVNKQTSRWKN